MAGHVVFQGHALSFLVAASVLFGSMFVAHSAIVKFAYEDMGLATIEFVEDVRSAVLSVPTRASNSMASVVVAEQYAMPGLIAHDLGDSVSGIFSEHISFGKVYSGPGPVEYYLGTEYPLNKVTYDSGLYAALGSTGLRAGELLRDAVQPHVRNLSSLPVHTAKTARAFSQWAVSGYVGSIYAWVNGSYNIAQKAVVATHAVGEATLSLASTAAPYAAERAEELSSHLVQRSHSVAAAYSEKQVALGEKLLQSIHTVRGTSAEIQEIAGARIANSLGEGVGFVSVAMLQLADATTASAADFLILER